MTGATLTSILALLLALLGGGDAAGLSGAISAIEQAPAFGAVCNSPELCAQMQQLQALDRVQERLREHQGEDSPACQAITRAMETIRSHGEGKAATNGAGAAEALQKALETVEANTPEHAGAAEAVAGALERAQERTRERSQEGGPQANQPEPQGPPDPMPQPPVDLPGPQGPPDPMPEPPVDLPGSQGPPDPKPGPPAEAPQGPSGEGGRGQG